MTLQDFSNSSPGTAEIRFFVGDTPKTIEGITISTSACSGLNTFEALLLIESITVTIGGSEYTLEITDRELKSGYFFLTVNPQYIPTLADTVGNSNSRDCNLTTFIPSVYDPTFENSNYNALFANATDIRLNTFAYDVDRVSSQVTASNLANILADNAIHAPVPDSNYTSIGLLNSRYQGSKTSVEEYGIESSINLTVFEASTYPLNTLDVNICSQSLQERNFESYGFDSSGNPSMSPNTLPTASYGSQFDGYIKGDSFNLAVLGSNETTFTALMKKRMVPYLTKGVFLKLTDTVYTGYVQLESVSFNSTYDFTQDYYDFVVKKHILVQSPTFTGNSTSSYNINIRIGLSDVVYFFEGNKIIPHSNKKLYLGLTGQILRTGDTGRVIDISSVCPI